MSKGAFKRIDSGLAEDIDTIKRRFKEERGVELSDRQASAILRDLFKKSGVTRETKEGEFSFF